MNYDEAPPFEIARYRDMQRAFPGVDSFYRLMVAQLEMQLPEGGHVLVVGAGGGREVEALGNSQTAFRITGVDPSEGMLNIARWYSAQSARPDATTLVHGLVDDVAPPCGGFDAATSLLVMHFLDDDGSADSKSTYLRTIRDRLPVSAPIIHADISVDDPCIFQAISDVFLRHAMLAGLDADVASLGPKMIQSMPIISSDRIGALSAEAGFSEPDLFFQALWYRAWIARAV